MSDNTVNMEKVAKKLATKIADLQYQVSQLEVIAEEFRDQRNSARLELAEALKVINRTNAAEVPVVTDPEN